MTSGRNLLGVAPPRPLRVAIINFEETRNTMAKRLAGAMKHYKLKPEDIGDRLFIVAKGELPEVNSTVATLDRYGVVRNDKAIQELIAYVRNNKLDVLIIDPFIATHGVHENDNVAIRQVVECYDTVAERGECAIDLYHHTRKLGGEETSDESARGARAFVDAIRAVRVLETMTKEEAKKLNIEHPGYYFRSFSGKRNYAPPMSESTWFRFVSVDLDNSPVLFGGDQVGVVTSWTHPGAKEFHLTPDMIVAIHQNVQQHRFREDVRATMWVGKAVALALGLDAATDRDLIKKLLQRLFRDKFLQLEPGQDEHRHSCMFVIVGPGPSNPGRGSS